MKREAYAFVAVTGFSLMAIFYVAAGVNHFVHPEFYLRIMPAWMPSHEFLVALSGVVEIILGLSLFFPAIRPLAARAIIAMLVVFLIVHVDMLIHAARHAVPYWVLVARIPLQFVLIAWAALYAGKRKTETAL